MSCKYNNLLFKYLLKEIELCAGVSVKPFFVEISYNTAIN